MSDNTPTVIIPAHNEQKNIATTLDRLQARNQDLFRIMVVCNGCSDATANIVRNYPSVLCEEIDVASKALAIRHAESQNPGFPRIYMDADIDLSLTDAIRLFDVAATPGCVHLVVPASRTDTKGCHYAVKAYYSIWRQSPYVKILGYGSGVYVLNREARNKFGEWPELIADDGYVRCFFDINDIQVVPESTAQVNAPKTLGNLIRIKTRSKYGALELKQHTPQQGNTGGERRAFNHKWLSRLLLTQPLAAATYICINLITSFHAKKYWASQSFTWLRDESNR